MSDDGKREKPRFEPPPWERDAFEELARKREEAEQAEREAAEVLRAAEERLAAAGETPVDPAQARARWVEQANAARETAPEDAAVAPAPEALAPAASAAVPAAAPAASAAAEPAPGPQAPAAPAAQLDERKVSAMLIELKAAEPSVHRMIGPTAKGASIVMGVIGTGVFIAGLVGLFKTAGNLMAMSAAGMTLAIGAMFVGTAIWIWIRATRGKGS